MNKIELFSAAKKAMDAAYAPYSDFKVGAALLCDDGTVFTGFNIENASYPVTCCAERTALFSAVAAGKRKFKAIMILGGRDGILTDYTYPCGICRQALSEFCDSNFIIMTGTDEDNIRELTLGELLPCSFTLGDDKS